MVGDGADSLDKSLDYKETFGDDGGPSQTDISSEDVFADRVIDVWNIH